MDKSFHIIGLHGFRLRSEWSATVGAVAIAAVGANIHMFIHRVSYEEGLRFGFYFWLLHLAIIFVHHAGHFVASVLVQRPMNGIELWWVFGRSLYPSDEAPLSPAQHIIRSLGGLIASAALALLLYQLLIYAPFQDDFSVLLLQLLFVDAVLMLIGAALPLSFTDGGTILANLRRIDTYNTDT